MDKQQLMMELMSGPGAQNPEPVAMDFGGQKNPMLDFNDPEAALLGLFQRRFNLSPEEVQQLSIPSPEPGLTLRQRLERLRPEIGGMRLGVDGNQITGNVRF